MSLAQQAAPGSLAYSVVRLDSSQIRNDVDLYFLQKAEARFGNGDGMFSGAEQEAALGAAAQVHALAAAPLSQSRWIQVGLQIDF